MDKRRQRRKGGGKEKESHRVYGQKTEEEGRGEIEREP